MILLLLVLLFIAVPILEIYVIIQVGEAIGVLWTIVLLVADSVLGSMLMRSQGRAAWRRFNAAIARGRPPAREALDGVLVVFGGALLLAPGFVTDGLGVVLLLPPTRAVVRRLLVRSLLRRGRLATSYRRSRFMRGADVEGTAEEVDQRFLR
ncbi:MAG TPA: FxsA family protein [Solirubrobacteraceae bacterium]|nr:FxsA family protein [Solirubrobacteraceae bacterium]